MFTHLKSLSGSKYATILMRMSICHMSCIIHPIHCFSTVSIIFSIQPISLVYKHHLHHHDIHTTVLHLQRHHLLCPTLLNRWDCHPMHLCDRRRGDCLGVHTRADTLCELRRKL